MITLWPRYIHISASIFPFLGFTVWLFVYPELRFSLKLHIWSLVLILRVMILQIRCFNRLFVFQFVIVPILWRTTRWLRYLYGWLFRITITTPCCSQLLTCPVVFCKWGFDDIKWLYCEIFVGCRLILVGLLVVVFFWLKRILVWLLWLTLRFEIVFCRSISEACREQLFVPSLVVRYVVLQYVYFFDKLVYRFNQIAAVRHQLGIQLLEISDILQSVDKMDDLSTYNLVLLLLPFIFLT